MGYRVGCFCDRCGNGFHYEENTSYGIVISKKIARKEGWSIGKKGWICPKCKKKRR